MTHDGLLLEFTQFTHAAAQRLCSPTPTAAAAVIMAAADDVKCTV